jgi:NAD(P)-dependent dehydrogenase (short-subunit alcohol dehydrogenase family)
MTTILITGSNKGLGYETARRLIGQGHTVYVGARDPERGRRAAERLGTLFVHLDMTDDTSVAAAAKKVADNGGLDVLVNNAGVEGRTRENGVIGAADEPAEYFDSIDAVAWSPTTRPLRLSCRSNRARVISACHLSPKEKRRKSLAFLVSVRLFRMAGQARRSM